MDPLNIIRKYYDEGSNLYNILLSHSQSVTEKALDIAQNHPELKANLSFIGEAAMLHDIGIFLTDAPEIGCFGEEPYICHGYLGSNLLQKEGYPQHALVCERHTGMGLTLRNIIENDLPLPKRDMTPVSIEEQIVCFADKFFSKSKLGEEKSVEKVRKSLSKYGQAQADRFDYYCKLFL